MDKKRKLDLICLVVAAGLALAAAYHYFIGSGLGTPFDTFLFDREDRFMDFFNNYYGWHENLGYRFEMSALSLVTFRRVLMFVFSLPPQPAAALVIYLSVFMAFFVFFNKKFVGGAGHAVILSFLTYPFLMAVDRGNCEMYVFLFLAAFIYNYVRGNPKTGVFFLSLAIATKPFPAVFLVLLAAEKRWRLLAQAVFWAAGIAAVSAAGLALANGFSLAHLFAAGDKKWMDAYQHNYVVLDMGLAYGHSYFGAIKTLLYSWSLGPKVAGISAAMIKPYFVFAAAVFAGAAAYVMFAEKTLWKKAAVLVCAMLCLPYVSADYRLLHLFLPLYLFINEPEKDPHDFAYCLLFGALLVPKAYYFVFPGDAKTLGLGVVLSPALMTALCFLIIRSGLSRRFLTAAGGK